MVDKYLWLQLIGVAPLFSPAAMVLEVCGLSWLVEDLFRDHDHVDAEKDR